jgi:hypothetical protein
MRVSAQAAATGLDRGPLPPRPHPGLLRAIRDRPGPVTSAWLVRPLRDPGVMYPR